MSFVQTHVVVTYTLYPLYKETIKWDENVATLSCHKSNFHVNIATATCLLIALRHTYVFRGILSRDWWKYGFFARMNKILTDVIDVILVSAWKKFLKF